MDASLPVMERAGARTGPTSAAMSPNRISADLERRSAASVKAVNTSSGRESADLSVKPSGGSRAEPPTPPGSPVDRPFPAAMLPPPPGASSNDDFWRLPAGRDVGDGGGRRGKSGAAAAVGGRAKTRRSKDGAASAANANEDCVRQPSDGYQVLDDNHRDDCAGHSSSAECRRKHDDLCGDHASASSTGHSVSSDSGESSSECDWSQDGDSSDDNSEEEGRAPREAADGMSSDTETECLL